MDNKKSRELLQQLHDEINNTQTVDEEGSELLRDLDGDIRELLERSGEIQLEVHPTVLQRLDDAVRHFEATHPELTSLISKVVDSLSNAGV
jgi:flagellar biosynthesis/type III secretory pathway protein FliH